MAHKRVAVAMAAVALACSSGATEENAAGNSGGSGSGLDGGNGTGATKGAGGNGGTGAGGVSMGGNLGFGAVGSSDVDGGGASGNVVIPGTECGAVALRGEGLSVDLYVMMDKSVSMGDNRDIYLIPGGGTKWDAVIEGFTAFVALPEVAGAAMGLDFFGQGADRCDPTTYSSPEVAVAALPGVGQDILDAFGRFAPGDNTPLTPALEGAIMAARAQQADSNRETVVVLVTDGLPNGCESDFDNLVEAARDGLEGDPSIKTFVLGITGQELEVDTFQTEMTRVATAGGSEALFIDATSELASEFSTALGSIHGQTRIPCQFGIPDPDSGDIDYNLVNVRLSDSDETDALVPRVEGESACGTESGWYYDDPSAPERIALCPSTCEDASSSPDAGIDVLVGCRAKVR